MLDPAFFMCVPYNVNELLRSNDTLRDVGSFLGRRPDDLRWPIAIASQTLERWEENEEAAPQQALDKTAGRLRANRSTITAFSQCMDTVDILCQRAESARKAANLPAVG